CCNGVGISIGSTAGMGSSVLSVSGEAGGVGSDVQPASIIDSTVEQTTNRRMTDSSLTVHFPASSDVPDLMTMSTVLLFQKSPHRQLLRRCTSAMLKEIIEQANQWRTQMQYGTIPGVTKPVARLIQGTVMIG